MPELPEVEASRRQLESHCVGLKITNCHALEAGGHARHGEFDNIVMDDAEASAAKMASTLIGKTLVGVRRRGKQLVLEMSSPPHLLAHFGMTGAFAIRGVAPLSYKEFKVHDEEWPPRFTKLELSFGKTALAFCDPRRLGRLRLRADPEHEDPWRSLAPDALLDLPTVDACRAKLAGTSCVVKALLLDQNKLVSGVGNWVADEVLFRAAIHPESPCDTLSYEQVKSLHAALHEILSVAVGCNAESQAFPAEWLFHYRWGKQAGGRVPGEKGGLITFATVGGRTSALVASRQRKGERTTKEEKAKAAGGSTPAAGKSSSPAKGKAAKKKEETAEKGEVEAATTARGKRKAAASEPEAAAGKSGRRQRRA